MKCKDIIYLLAAILISLAISIEAKPQSVLDHQRKAATLYNAGNMDPAIAEYTTVIQMDPTISSSYRYRGQAFRAREKYDEAIRDFTKFIELEPKNEAGYGLRAFTYLYLGNYEKALADYDKTLEINPGSYVIYRCQSWINLMQDKGATAYELSNKFLALNALTGKNADYGIITGYLGLRKAHRDAEAQAFVDNWLKLVKPDDWTTKALQFFHGDITVVQYFVLAGNSTDKLTELHTYVGELQLLEGSTDKAKIHFAWVKDNGNKTFFEYLLANAELAHLTPRSSNSR